MVLSNSQGLGIFKTFKFFLEFLLSAFFKKDFEMKLLSKILLLPVQIRDLN